MAIPEDGLPVRRLLSVEPERLHEVCRGQKVT
jgi:hypothetical protein